MEAAWGTPSAASLALNSGLSEKLWNRWKLKMPRKSTDIKLTIAAHLLIRTLMVECRVLRNKSQMSISARDSRNCQLLQAQRCAACQRCRPKFESGSNAISHLTSASVWHAWLTSPLRPPQQSTRETVSTHASARNGKKLLVDLDRPQNEIAGAMATSQMRSCAG